MDLIRLNNGIIALYCVSFKAFPGMESLGGLLDGISGEERTRVSNFRFDANKKEYLLSHYFLRKILGIYLDKNPLDVAFERNELGKPVLKDVGSSLHFNLSHCQSHSAIAVCEGTPVGVDAESVERRLTDLEEIVERFFSREERDFIFSSTGELRHKAFLRCWTMKEAYLKALGHGITVPLSSFSVPVKDPSQVLNGYQFWLMDEEDAQFCVSYPSPERTSIRVEPRFIHS